MSCIVLIWNFFKGIVCIIFVIKLKYIGRFKIWMVVGRYFKICFGDEILGFWMLMYIKYVNFCEGYILKMYNCIYIFRMVVEFIMCFGIYINIL